MQSSLSVKIITRIGLAVSCCVFLLGLFEFYQTRAYVQQELDAAISEVKQRLVGSLAMPLWNIDRDIVEAIIITEMQNKNISGVAVRDSLSGDYLVVKGRGDDWQIVNHEDPGRLEKGARTADFLIMLKGEELGRVYLHVTDSFARAELTERVTALVVRLVILLLLVFVLLIFVINLVVTRPILHLSRNCRRIAGGDFGAELDTSRGDEIGSLAKSFANMQKDIETNITALNVEIRERKNSEKEIRNLRGYLSNIVDSMPSILVSVDSNCLVNQWNLEAEKVTEVGKDSACGKVFTEVLPCMQDKLEMVEDVLQNGVAKNESRVPIIIKGQERIADITIYPLFANGCEGAVIRLDDVTERVKIEEMMVQTEKMLSVGGLAAGMAHEINNPLAGIMQSAQVIQNRLSPELPRNRQAAQDCGVTMEKIVCYQQKREIPRMLGSIIDSGERAARIIDNMLSFSRKSESSFLLCDLAELLDKTVELASNDYDLKKKYDFRKIKIDRRYDRQVAQVRCDAVAIQQVFLNVLKNAAQAMTLETETADQAEMQIEKPRIVLRIYQTEEYAYVAFEDNGRGMEGHILKRVFEPFFSTKEVGVGTGLGLSVSYFIIRESHKGTFRAISTPGKGSIFTIGLPRTAEG